MTTYYTAAKIFTAHDETRGKFSREAQALR